MGSVQYIVHESPAWRAAADYLAMADLAPFGFPDMKEQIWLRSLPDGTYEVCCIPFRVYGVSLGDTVELDDGGKTIVRVRSKGGHRAFRVFFLSKVAESKLEDIRNRIDGVARAESLAVEWSGDRHVAVDVTTDSEIGVIWREIQAEVDNGSALWEWGDVEDFRSWDSATRG